MLDETPKRDRLVDEEAEFSEDQDVKVFWGPVAREQRSALRVVVYMLLGLGPSPMVHVPVVGVLLAVQCCVFWRRYLGVREMEQRSRLG